MFTKAQSHPADLDRPSPISDDDMTQFNTSGEVKDYMLGCMKDLYQAFEARGFVQEPQKYYSQLVAAFEYADSHPDEFAVTPRQSIWIDYEDF